MTASSFAHAPGLPILHSRDLVNWTLVNHALPALVPAEHFATPRHGCGVWAPALRHHAGLFWIFYPDPDFGIHVITATDPRGTWSAPRLLKAGRGLIDPCPLWDDDGRAYFIHGWAKSRAGINNLLTLHEISPDATTLLDQGRIVIDANLMPGWKTLEGPKLYKRDGWYWVFAPAGGVAEGYQAVFRSRDIHGPYEARNVLEQGSTPINGPHQGAWVETQVGEHWFCHFQELPALGRVVHLQPMRWNADGWPVMGHAPEGAQRGEPVLRHRKPALPTQPVCEPATSDDFASPRLGLQWQWEANPKPEWLSLTERPGRLRLRCQPLPPEGNLWASGHLLMQKLPAPTFTATTCIEFAPAAPGDSAALIVFGYDYASLGLHSTAQGLRLCLLRRLAANKGGAEQTLVSLDWDAPVVHLRLRLHPGRRCRFSYSGDAKVWTEIDHDFLVPSSHWVGAKVGLVASCASEAPSGGFLDCDRFLMERS
jgi:beta-xylosidase